MANKVKIKLITLAYIVLTLIVLLSNLYIYLCLDVTQRYNIIDSPFFDMDPIQENIAKCIFKTCYLSIIAYVIFSITCMVLRFIKKYKYQKFLCIIFIILDLILWGACEYLRNEIYINSIDMDYAINTLLRGQYCVLYVWNIILTTCLLFLGQYFKKREIQSI